MPRPALVGPLSLLPLLTATFLLIGPIGHLARAESGRLQLEGQPKPPASGPRADPRQYRRRLHIVAPLRVPPGNLTVTPRGQIVFSLHQHFKPKMRVASLGSDNRPQPFPNRAMNGLAPHEQSEAPFRFDTPKGGRVQPGEGPVLNSVLGIQCDERGVVWMLDNGMRSGVTPKLVAWDTNADRLHRVIYLPEPITVEASFVNDLAVDRDRGYLYIADPAGQSSALIVVNLQTGHARRVLQGHFSLCPKPIDLVIDGQPVQIETDQGKRVRPHVGVNPIALDPDGRWLYFGPMHGRRMYRLPTAALRDGSLEEWQLAQLIEDWAAKPISDGSSADTAGNVYISDVGNHAIGVSTVSGYHVIAQDERLLKWPDAFSFGPDGMLYVATNQLHLGPVLNAGQDASEPPYFILRLRPLAPGRVGR